MLNAERFKEEINKYNNEFGLADNIVDCGTLGCRNCRFSHSNNSDGVIIMCSTRKVKWLLSEYEEHTKLTKLEFELLKFWHKQGYKYIARDRDNTLFIYKDKPSKLAEYWANLYHYSLDDNFRNLFEFVEWEDKEPTPIKDVLENCEVVNDAEE